MTKERWQEVMNDFDSKLTVEELKEKWHFCPEFDGCLMQIGEPGCDCTNWTEEEIKKYESSTVYDKTN